MSQLDAPETGTAVLPELEGLLVDAARRRARPRRRRLPRRRLVLAVAPALVVLIAAGLIGGGVFSGGSGPGYAEAAIEVAEANPRLLVTAPGWKVTDAGEFRVEEGETVFTDGDRTLTLNWYPARLYRSLLRDRSQVSAPRHSRLLGRAATTVDYGRDDYATILAPSGRVFVEVRGGLGGHAAYEEVLHSLRPIDVDAWLAAMPAGVVDPGAARARTVDRMLRGIPRPPGFDPARLEEGTAVLDHYALGVQVAGAVSCGWVESWLAARRSGDPTAERAAVDAMAGSHRWPLLLRMQEEGPRQPGSWALNVWHVASELRAGHLDRGFGEALVRPDGTGYRLGPAWATALECHGAIRREPFDAEKPSGAG